MSVLMFQHRFAPKVRTGEKPHTIRPKRKRPIKVGERLSLRMWEGAAYRSKHVELREDTCIGVLPIRIDDYAIPEAFVQLAGHRLSPSECDCLAKADGFDDGAAMLAWFRETHGLPFEGELIAWKAVRS